SHWLSFIALIFSMCGPGLLGSSASGPFLSCANAVKLTAKNPASTIALVRIMENSLLNVDLGDVGKSYFPFLRRAEDRFTACFISVLSRRQPNVNKSCFAFRECGRRASLFGPRLIGMNRYLWTNRI